MPGLAFAHALEGRSLCSPLAKTMIIARKRLAQQGPVVRSLIEKALRIQRGHAASAG